jgi:agmatinase
MNALSFLGLEGEQASAESPVVVLPIPLEKTTTYQVGCKKGPTAILRASDYLEFYDPLFERQTCRVGIATDQHIDCRPPLNKCIDVIYQRALYWLQQKKFLLSLGGEHSISIGIFKALKEVYGPITILQFDAHADLRQSYHGSPFNHACVMARARDEGHRIVQCGIRALSEEEAELIKRDDKIDCFYDHDTSWKTNLQKVIDKIEGPTYLTIDVDGINPDEMPATGTPVPGGLNWEMMNGLIEKLFNKVDVVGADINELKPHKDLKHCDFYCAQLAYRIIGHKAQQSNWKLNFDSLSDQL